MKKNFDVSEVICSKRLFCNVRIASQLLEFWEATTAFFKCLQEARFGKQEKQRTQVYDNLHN